MKIVKLTMEHVNKGTNMFDLPEYFRGMDMFDLPEYFRGTEKQCRGAMLRFEWCRHDNLVGGYWKDADQDCYFLIP